MDEWKDKSKGLVTSIRLKLPSICAEQDACLGCANFEKKFSPEICRQFYVTRIISKALIVYFWICQTVGAHSKISFTTADEVL